MNEIEPGPEHLWLQRLVGEWTFEGECSMGPDQPPFKHGGREVVRSLGGLWVVCEMITDTPQGPEGQSLLTLGHDPQKGQFTGTFIASCMTHLWIYQGKLDPNGSTLVLDTVGPSQSGNGLTPYQDCIAVLDEDHRTLTSRVLDETGCWTHFMTANYKRIKTS